MSMTPTMPMPVRSLTSDLASVGGVFHPPSTPEMWNPEVPKKRPQVGTSSLKRVGTFHTSTGARRFSWKGIFWLGHAPNVHLDIILNDTCGTSGSCVCRIWADILSVLRVSQGHAESPGPSSFVPFFFRPSVLSLLPCSHLFCLFLYFLPFPSELASLPFLSLPFPSVPFPFFVSLGARLPLADWLLLAQRRPLQVTMAPPARPLERSRAGTEACAHNVSPG